MKNTKKVLSVALAGALAFGCAGAAFAAAPEMDKDTDKKVVEAVERLNAFGIVNGMEDGKYHEEMKVTRAQFAKILVEALGLGGVVGQSTTSFSDVDSNHWASGYVAVATGQGLLKGYADGTFKPEKEVSYAEAVTMLVRALGYKDEFLKGSWPSNYVSKAAELDITDGVKVSTGTADRGAVAVMVDNTLDANPITQNTYGDDNNWTESEKTLLEEKLEIDKFEDAKIEANSKTDKSLDKNEVKAEIEVKEDEFKTETYEVVEGIDTTNLLGLEADIYVNDDDEIVYVDVTTDEDEALTGVVTKIASGELTLQTADGNDDDYDFVAKDVYGYVNNEEIENGSELSVSGSDEYFGKIVLNDKEDVSFVDLYKFDSDKGIIVKEINTDKKYVKGLQGTSDNAKADFDKEDGYKLFLDGKQIKIEDIKVGDLVYSVTVNEYDGDDYVYGFVVRNAVEGKLERVKSGEIKIAGKEYDVNAKATYSLDKDDDIEDYGDVEKLEDAIGKEVKVYLDAKGEVRHITTDANETSDELYGIAVKDGFLSSGDEAIKLLTKDGKEVTYKFDDSDDMEDQGLDNVKEGDIIKYELTKDGEIDAEHSEILVKEALVTGGNTKEASVTKFDDDKDYIKVTGLGNVYVDEDTIVMSYYDEDDTTEVNPDLVKWDDIKDKTPGENLKAYVKMDDDGINAEFVVFTEGYNLSADGNSAYVTGDVYYDGDYKVDLELADGTSKTIEVDKDKKDAMEEGDFIVFSTNEDGEIDDLELAVHDAVYAETSDIARFGTADEPYTMDGGKVVTFKNDVIKLASGSYKVTDDTAVYVLELDSDNEYDEVAKGDTSDIDDGSEVRIVINDGDVEMVVVVER